MANNTIAAGGNGPDCYTRTGGSNPGYLDSQGYNLIQDTSACTIIGDTTGNIIGQDSQLGPLADNGGPTFTHALLSNSPAIEAGSCSDISVDQRGFLRPVDIPNITNVDDACDIGAYEAQPVLSLTKTVDTNIPTPDQEIAYTITLSNSGIFTATDTTISDTLPSGINFVGPIELEPSIGGTIGDSSTLPILATNLTIMAGEQITLTFPITVGSDLVGGQIITNIVAVTSTEITLPITDGVPITIANVPAITITKTASVETTSVGETITYTYRVTNVGNVSLHNLAASDTPLGMISLGESSLAPGQGTVGILTYIIVESDLPGPLTNTATVTGTPFSDTSIIATAIASVAIFPNNNLDNQVYLPLILKNN